jgi:hypothetical protein
LIADIEKLPGLYAAALADLPGTHADFGEAVVLNPGVVPGLCRGRVHRVDAKHREVAWDVPPIYDHSAPMEGAPDRPRPVYLFRCGGCGGVQVLEGCCDERGRAYFRMCNDYGGVFAPDDDEATAAVA